MENKLFRLFRSYRAKVTFALMFSITSAVALSVVFIYDYSYSSQMLQLRSKLMSLARAGAMQVDANALTGIPPSGNISGSPAYKALSRSLAKFIEVSPSITYCYILVKTDKEGIFKFVTDVSSRVLDGQKKPASPGDSYDGSRFPELMEAFKGPTADTDLVEDTWGVSMSGYAPITGPSGKVIGILGIDLKADDVMALRREVIRRAGLLFAIGFIFSIIFGFFVSGLVAWPIKELARGTRFLAKGDLGHLMKARGSTEIEELSASFNMMAADLKEHIETLGRATAERERLMRELEIARGIQESFLPEVLPRMKGFEVAVFTLPASVVGGDFYDFIPLDHGKWGIVVADVSGKGIPAAMFMALSKTIFNITAKDNCSEAEVVERANRLIMDNNRTNMFVTLFYGTLDENTCEFTFANAGHNPSMLVREGTDDIRFLEAQGIPLGMFQDNKMTQEKIKLKRGDILVLYTDGIVEAINRAHDQFGVERLYTAVRQNRELPAGGVLEKVRDELKRFVSGEPQFDDMTLLVLKVK